MPNCGATVVALSHFMNGITHLVIPIASYFAYIMCHTLAGDRNGVTISGCTREKGDIDTIVIDTLSSLGVSADNLGVSGGKRASDVFMSAYCGTSTSLGVIHAGGIMTVAGSCPRQISLTKARNFLSFVVQLAKDGLTNWFPQSTMVCVSGEYKYNRTRGFYPNGKSKILSGRFLKVVFCPAYSSSKMARKLACAGLCNVAATLNMVSLIILRFVGGGGIG